MLNSSGCEIWFRTTKPALRGGDETEKEGLHNMPASLTVSISLFLLFESGGERGKEKWRDFAEYQAETEGEMDPHIVLKTVKVQVSMVYQDYGSFTFVGCVILERKHMHINYGERTFKNKKWSHF